MEPATRAAPNENTESTAALSPTPFQHLPWDVIENVFLFLEPADIVSFACANKIQYVLAHGHLWRKPSLSLTQAMIFTRFIYRRPVVTNALPPTIGDVVQKERPLCVVTVQLRLEREIPAMLEIALESVVRRIISFCPQATFEIHLNKKDEDSWKAMLTEAERLKVTVKPHEIEDKSEDTAT